MAILPNTHSKLIWASKHKSESKNKTNPTLDRQLIKLFCKPTDDWPEPAEQRLEADAGVDETLDDAFRLLPRVGRVVVDAEVERREPSLEVALNGGVVDAGQGGRRG